MDVEAALLAMTTGGLISLIAACGGGGEASNSAPVQTGSPSAATPQSTTTSIGGASAAGGTNNNGSAIVNTGPVMGPCGSTTTITRVWPDWPDTLAFDAPMVFLAEPGPVTATLIAAPAHDSSWRGFSTYYDFSQDAIHTHNLGITSDDSVGKSVTTVSIPAQPAGVPIVFSASVGSDRTLGTFVSTGWVYGSGVDCCDLIVRVPAQVSFGTNNTAIVSFGGPNTPDSWALPDSWSTTPLRIQLTNVTSVSGCRS